MSTATPLWAPETISAEPYNAQTPAGALLQHLTPADALFVRDHFGVPRLDPRTWRLGLAGEVDRPYDLGYRDLLAMEQREIETVLECAGNGRSLMSPRPPGLAWGERAVGCARFTGVPFAALAERLGVRADAVEFVFTGADAGEFHGRPAAFERSLPTTVVLRPDTLLATHLNGHPLTAAHGAPVRLVVPGHYGVADVKWLVSVRAVAEPFTGPFQADSYVYRRSRGGRGGTQDGPVTAMRVKSLVTAPGPGSVLRAGETVRVTGHAWSGAGPIRSVEVRADDGDWQPSVLGPSTGRYGWTGWTDWTYAWTAPCQPGPHTLTVRATDVTGASQPLRPPWNEDGYGCNPVAELQLIIEA